MSMTSGLGRPTRGLSKDPALARHKLAPGTWRRVLGYGRPYRGLIAVFVALIVLSSVLNVVPPLLFRRIIDDGVLRHNDGLIIELAVVVAVLAVVDAAATLAERWCSSRLGEGLIFDLRTAVFDHVSAMPVAFFSRTHTGKLVSRIHSDVIGAQQAFTSALSNSLSSLIQLVLVLVAMASLSPWLTLISLALLPVFLFPARAVGRRLADLTRRSATYNGEVSATMTERFSVSGALLVKLFGRPADEHRLFAERAGVLRGTGVQIALVQRFFLVMMTLVAALATALIYGMGGLWAARGQLSVGTLTALVALLGKLYGPLISLTNVRVDLMSAMVSFERVFEVLDLVPMVRERPGAVPLTGEPSISFQHVGFTYPRAEEVSLPSLEPTAAPDAGGDREVLHDVSFEVAPGQTVALVGPSGAGKTTLTHLLARLYDPTSGAVRIGGQDLREITFASLQDTLGYVTQDAHMFHDTIRSNLLYARPDAAEPDLWRALAAARIDDLVRRLPDGLDTVVGERGYRLSGGERQRLAIARLLVKNPPIVVLDEATAHLDSESERAVQEALDEAMAERTSVVIAHRLSTIRGADEILVVADGRIVERGRHDQLLAVGGVYADLHRTQFAARQ